MNSIYLLSLTTIAKIIFGLFIVKFLSVFLGPDGFGALGNLMSFAAVVSMLSGAGLMNGLIKNLAKDNLSKEYRDRVLQSSFSISTVFSIFISIFIFIFYFFDNGVSDSLIVFLAISFSQFLIGWGSLIQAEASSRKDVILYVKINILGGFLGCVFLVFLVSLFRFEGAEIGIVVNAAFVGVVAVSFLFKKNGSFKLFKFLYDAEIYKNLFSYSFVTLFGAVALPLAHIYMRDRFAVDHGWTQVGYWQGAVKMSDVYMQLVGVILINYALPKFSMDKKNIKFNLLKVLIFILSLMLIVGSVYYVFSSFIISLIFSDEFFGMREYIFSQLVGDIFRSLASAISYYFLSAGIIWVSIGYEILQGVFMVLFFYNFHEAWGEMSMVYAHVSTYVLLFFVITMIFFFKRIES